MLVVSAIWQLDTVSRFSSNPQLALASLGGSAPPEAGAAAGLGSGQDERPWLAPRLEIACHVVMALTMAYMLVLVT